MINYSELSITTNTELEGKNVRLFKVFKNKETAKCPYTFIVTFKSDGGYVTAKYFGCKALNEIAKTLEVLDDINNELYTNPRWYKVTKTLHKFNDGNEYYSFDWVRLPPKENN